MITTPTSKYRNNQMRIILLCSNNSGCIQWCHIFCNNPQPVLSNYNSQVWLVSRLLCHPSVDFKLVWLCLSFITVTCES